MKQIVAVWSRSLAADESVGRLNVARRVLAALEDCGSVSNLLLNNAFEPSRRAGSLTQAAVAFVTGMLTGRLLPLQCALFASSAGRSDPLSGNMNADVVYVDGIRMLVWLRRLRRLSPRVRIVVDLDDLMSRRYSHLMARRLPLSLGYMERVVPRVLLAPLKTPAVARAVLAYERLALRRAELEILGLADVVVLLNEREAFLLQEAGAQSGRAIRAQIIAIPPSREPTPNSPAIEPVERQEDDLRAVFVGTDGLVQNRLTIAYLLRLWTKAEIDLPLVIYGRQRQAWPETRNVTFRGYVDDIAKAYVPGSILVCPSFLPGGIKTKTLEAFAHGVPVVGNDATFEGLSLKEHPLLFNAEEDLVAFLSHPLAYRRDIDRAISLANAYLLSEHSAQRFTDRWHEALFGHHPEDAGETVQRPAPASVSVQRVPAAA